MERRNPTTITSLLLHVCGILGYSGYIAANVLFLLAALPVALALSVAPPLRTRLLRGVFQAYLTLLTRQYLPFLRIYRFREISGLERAPAGAAVYVANHRSRIDGLVLLAMLPGAATVIKSYYAKWPVFASFVKYLDFIPVDQKALSSLQAAVDRCKFVLASGRSVLIFPEGARAPSGRVQQFGDLAFRIAMEARVAVIPVVIHTDFPFMAKRPGSIFPGRTLAMTVRFLPPCTYGAGDRPGDLADRARRLLVGELAALDKGTPWEI